jgi:hypothetical protein
VSFDLGVVIIHDCTVFSFQKKKKKIPSITTT